VRYNIGATLWALIEGLVFGMHGAGSRKSIAVKT